MVKHDDTALIELINAPDQKTFAGFRDYTLILLTLDTGIRPKEAFTLLPDDFNPRASELYVRAENSKTRVSRTLNISPQTNKAISDLIAYRSKDWKKNTPIFCTNEGNPLTRYTWGDRMEIYSKKLGTKIIPYDLRHSFAVGFLRGGGNALALQRTLGHSDLTMTKRYVNLAESDLKEQHAMASPLNRLMPVKKRVSKL
ncbi:Tyrosine recombinase XerD [compost metagenome]